MNILKFLRNNKSTESALAAKERLQVIVAHERILNRDKDFLPDMQRDILQVINKYLSISQEDINIKLDNDGQCSVLELNIQIPEKRSITTP